MDIWYSGGFKFEIIVLIFLPQKSIQMIQVDDDFFFPVGGGKTTD